ncbi:MAG: Zn-binding domain-containing protein, partial [Candidatus Aerophobetes bacterium]|nr:Zn-binding domain-containing protein [Candidatus Aerophobetes bacterium]
KKLTGLSFNLITREGSPKGKKYFIFYNPYFDGIGMLSTHQEVKNLLLFFVKNNLQTLCFTVSRKMAELVALWSKKELKESEPFLMDKITAYRAGYLPEERRKIEDNLKNGLLRGVTSTNALELGIDIGSLDSVIISGYPGTLISTWQQAGRAGRGTDESVVTLIAFQNPLDQYLMRHPEAFFGNSYEHAIIDLSNPYIISGHLMCAASELPIKVNKDRVYFGENCEDILELLGKKNLLQLTPNGWVYSGKGRAVEIVQLKNISSDIFKIICEGEVLETMDRPQAYREAHKGAVLFHQGETYIVEDVDLKNSLINVKKKDVDYHTRAMKVVDIKILDEIERKKVSELAISLGRVRVKEEYVGYKIIKYDKVIGMESLSLPPLNFNTIALWFTISGDIKKRVKDESLNFGGGLHGAEHAMIGIMPFHVMCERSDIGGVSSPNHPDTTEPTIFIYDGFEGGIGLSEKAFDLIVDIIEMSYELVRDCKCEDGCPACIYSPKCGNDNKPLDKKATKIILEELLARVRSEK